jgi:hypothetical protein
MILGFGSTPLLRAAQRYVGGYDEPARVFVSMKAYVQCESGKGTSETTSLTTCPVPTPTRMK